MAVLDGFEATGDGPHTDREFGMSEQTAPTTGTEDTNEQGKEQQKEFVAITSQADFDAAIQARIARERAKFADYDEVKAKADKLAEFEDAQKTEAQKAQERLEAAEKRAVELELKATRAEVAATKGVPVELLSGSTQAELEAAADALIAFKGTAPNGPVLPDQGKSPTTQANTERDFIKGLFGNVD